MIALMPTDTWTVGSKLWLTLIHDAAALLCIRRLRHPQPRPCCVALRTLPCAWPKVTSPNGLALQNIMTPGPRGGDYCSNNGIRWNDDEVGRPYLQYNFSEPTEVCAGGPEACVQARSGFFLLSVATNADPARPTHTQFNARQAVPSTTCRHERECVCVRVCVSLAPTVQLVGCARSLRTSSSRATVARPRRTSNSRCAPAELRDASESPVRGP